MEEDCLGCLFLWLHTVIANEGSETGREILKTGKKNVERETAFCFLKFLLCLSANTRDSVKQISFCLQLVSKQTFVF